jgi:hypothetical protein
MSSAAPTAASSTRRSARLLDSLARCRRGLRAGEPGAVAARRTFRVDGLMALTSWPKLAREWREAQIEWETGRTKRAAHLRQHQGREELPLADVGREAARQRGAEAAARAGLHGGDDPRRASRCGRPGRRPAQPGRVPGLRVGRRAGRLAAEALVDRRARRRADDAGAVQPSGAQRGAAAAVQHAAAAGRRIGHVAAAADRAARHRRRRREGRGRDRVREEILGAARALGVHKSDHADQGRQQPDRRPDAAGEVRRAEAPRRAEADVGGALAPERPPDQEHHRRPAAPRGSGAGLHPPARRQDRRRAS